MLSAACSPASAPNTPWLYLDIDRAKAKTMGVSIGDVFNTLQVYLGSLYVNDFNRFGRTWQVNVQADAEFPQRDRTTSSSSRSATSRAEWCRSAACCHVREVERAGDGHRATTCTRRRRSTATPRPASARARRSTPCEAARQRADLPHDPMRTEWTELALLQLQTGNTAMFVFVLAVVLVFLVLAAQYESWSLPLAVILVVPMCLLCSIAGVIIARMDINIFTQIGFIVLVGLACKNAILIVEFAKAAARAGVPRLRGDARRLPAAAAADHHDLVRLHPGRGAAGDRRRGRGRDAAHARHGRLQRHAGRDALRHLPDAGLLLRHPVDVGHAAQIQAQPRRIADSGADGRRCVMVERWGGSGLTVPGKGSGVFFGLRPTIVVRRWPKKTPDPLASLSDNPEFGTFPAPSPPSVRRMELGRRTSLSCAACARVEGRSPVSRGNIQTAFCITSQQPF